MVQAGLALALAWLARHPNDGAMRDVGEPIAMLAEALEIVACEEQKSERHARMEAPAA